MVTDLRAVDHRSGVHRGQWAGTSEKVLDRKLEGLAVAWLNGLGDKSDEYQGVGVRTALGPATQVRRVAPADHGRVTNSRSGRGQAARCWKTTVNGGHSWTTKPQVRAHIGWSDAP